MAVNSYTDLSSVQGIRSLAGKDKHQALEKIAGQFESMMIQMMLKSMREANANFSDGNFLQSNETEFYQGMLDDQLSLSLTEGRGMGIADIMVRQLMKNYGDGAEVPAPADVKPENALPARRAFPSNHAVPATSAAASTNTTAEMEFDGSAENFVSRISESAQKAAKELGVDARWLMAQAALETGWGAKMCRDEYGRPSNNLFNIKADQRWQGDSVRVSTVEYRDGVASREQAQFRAYQSVAASFDDFVNFIKGNSRYQQALASDNGEDFVRCLSEAGYATDPNYVEKVARIANSDAMRGVLPQLTSEQLD